MICRKEIIVVYEVLNDSNEVIGTEEFSGFNERNIQWKAERVLYRKYNKHIRLHKIKIISK